MTVAWKAYKIKPVGPGGCTDADWDEMARLAGSADKAAVSAFLDRLVAEGKAEKR